MVAIALPVVVSVLPTWRGSAQTMRSGATRAPLVSVVEAPAGTEKLAVQWIRIADADLGVMLAAVARPSGPGLHPVVVSFTAPMDSRTSTFNGLRTWRAVGSSPLPRVGFQEEAAAPIS